MMQKTLGTVALFVSAVTVAGCFPSEPHPFDPKALEQIQKQAAKDFPVPEMRPLPTTLPALVEEAGPAKTQPASPATQPIGLIVRLPLQEIIHRAVANNYDVRVAGYQPAIDEARILEAQARFDPTIISTLQAQRQWQQRSTPTTQPTELLTLSAEAGFQQQLESGGQIRLTNRVTRYEFDETLAFPPVSDHLHQNDVILQITQPLLRDFGAEVNRARITIARNDQKISELEFRNELEQMLQRVEETYWQLALAERDVQIQEQLLTATEATLDLLIKRQGQDVTRVQTSLGRLSVEQRNALLLQARARIGDLSDQLKRLMNDPELAIGGPVTILPANLPVEEPVRLELADQIETALHNRLELMQQSLRIDSANVIRRAAKNNELPRLDLQGTVDFLDLARDVSDTWDYQDSDFVNYTLGLQFELPIGNRAARAITQRTLLQHAQAVDQYRLLVQQVALDVSTAMRAVKTYWDQIIANRYARFAAQDALDAIQQQENAGVPLTPSFVQLKLDRQADLAQAARAEIEAVARYNIALTNLEKAKGTLLRYDNVIMKEQKGPNFVRLSTEPKKKREQR